MTIQEMKDKKRELGYTYAQIADYSGVPIGTVQKIFNGATTSPRYETIQALTRFFENNNQPVTYNYESKPALLHEPTAAYGAKKQGDYDLDDYYQIPDDIRVELIDGVIYDMGAPTSTHQLIAGLIYHKLLSHVFDHKGSCLPMISPLDVQLDCDNKTMVQPDVLIICDRSKVINRCIYGAPDFIIEVLSPSTRRKDMLKKADKYANAGVREYWMIDPKKCQVIVYLWGPEEAHDDSDSITIYTFDDTIPVGIWNGECTIDFKEVYEHIAFLYQ